MSRMIPFNAKERCDECGIKGCYDFCGDLLCERCARQYIDSEYEENYEEEKED